MPADGYLPIEDHGFIGDMHTAALVGINGTVDWMCYPHFDSPAVFARILDKDKGGYFSIAPIEDANHRVKQMYHADTNILVTRFLSDAGVGEIQDFMPVDSAADAQRHHRLVRRVQVTRGTLRFRMECVPAFNYARTPHTLTLHESGGATFQTDVLGLGLVTPQDLVRFDAGGGTSPGVYAEFTLKQGEQTSFLLQRAAPDGSPGPLLAAGEIGALFDTTLSYWRRWIAQCTYRGRWQEVVRRSALALKLMTFEPTGALVAAPTAGLPESIGHGRNWDYRYTWIRDAAFTVFALRRIGFGTEADAFLGWVLDAFEQSRQPRIMYDLDGSPVPDEREDPELEGYRRSAPVRWGNGAADQRQHDVYGEILDCADQWARSGRQLEPPLWAALAQLADMAGDAWRQPDQGIWEVRSEGRVFTYSAAMCQVALDRATAIAERLGLPGPVPAWRAAAGKLRQTIMDQSWDEDAQTLSEHLDGGGSLDASLLALPLRRVIPADHPRMVATTAAVAERLSAGDGLLYRYLHHDSPDGIAGDEGAFLLCSFWLVENLALQGRLDEAGQLYASLCARASPLGLLPEQIDPSTGEFIGNFPQAFSHIGVIASGVTLARALAATGGHKGAAGAQP
jgi:alpha,alpha-trehalase